jgi:hypothetical protein
MVSFLLKFGSASEVSAKAHLNDDHSTLRADVRRGVWEEEILDTVHHDYVGGDSSGLLS